MDPGTYLPGRQIAVSPLGVLSEGVQRETRARALLHRLVAPAQHDAQLESRLQQLATLLGKQEPPGMLPLLAVERMPDGGISMALQYVPGEVVSARLSRNEAASLTEVLHVALQVARILERAHRHGTAHLSLTPNQILLTADRAPPAEGVWLLGLGIAEVLGLRDARGWPAHELPYAAPEQRTPGANVDGRADVFALGTLISSWLAKTHYVPAELLEFLTRMKAARPQDRPNIAAVVELLIKIGKGEVTQPRAPDNATVPMLHGKPDPRIGMLVGNYRIKRKLGEGGMGVVYEAEHEQIGSRAAVKLLHSSAAKNDEYSKRFLNEARAVNIVRHRGLVQIFEFGKLPDGNLYYVMEYLEGRSARSWMDERAAALPEAEVLSVATQIAHALAAAHEKGIIHRDLKPENIMLLPDPVKPDGPAWAKVLDFGIAKVRGRPKQKAEAQDEDEDRTDLQTGMGAFMGTALYMAPEQHGGAEAVDGKADVFALGVTVYEMLAGKRPFRTHALNLLANAAPPLSKLNPGVSTRLEALVQRMMALEVTARPTMAEVLQQLTALAPRPAAKTKKRVFALAAGAGFALGALVVLIFLLKPHTPTAAELRNQAQKILTEYLHGQEPSLRVLAARALGQSRDLDQRPLLEPYLQDKSASPELVAASAEALGRIEALEARSALLRLALDKSVPTVQLAAAGALSQLRHPQGGEVLKQLLGSDDKLTQLQTALTMLERRDGAGAPLLWSRIERGRLADNERISLLGGLAQTGDARARLQLTEELNRLPPGDARVYAAYYLGALDDEAAGSKLKSMAARLGPEQLLAARLLAGLGVLTGYAELEKTASASDLPDAMRDLAIAGLADAAQPGSLEVLWKALSERGASPRLRIAAAGAILRITAGDRARLAEQRLRWARAAIGSDSASMRELAVSLLGDLESEQAVTSLGQALRDEQANIRETAADLLGRKPTRAALQIVSSALSDREGSVRVAALGSIGRIIKALQQQGDSAAKDLVLGKLRNLAQSGSESDRVVASIVLLSVGEGQPEHSETLRRGLQSKDARVRRLIVERIDPDREVFTKALTDPDRGVRTYAAMRLAALQSREGIPVLKEAALRGDLDGLKAFGHLLRLGETVQPPPALATLLRTGELPTRRAVLEIIPELPSAEARSLLQLALLDNVPTIRRHAVDATAELYRRRKEPLLLDLLRRALNDSALPVRSRAISLLDELLRGSDTLNRPDGGAGADLRPPSSPRLDMQSSVDLKTPTATPPPAPTAGSKNGTLICEGDELVPVQIDKRPFERIIGKEIVLVGGVHFVRYLGGERRIVITPAQTTRIRIPVGRSELRVQTCKDALRRKDLQACQDELDALRREQGRRQLSAALVADTAYLQGQIYEGRGQLDVAIQHYNKALNVPAAQRPATLNGELEAMIRRLASKVGRVQIFKPADGRCEMVSEFISPPGETVKSLGPGQQRRFYVRAGATTQDKEACK